MIFDGIKWSVCKTVVDLPRNTWRDGCHVEFGKITSRQTHGSIKTEYFWRNSVPIKFAGDFPILPPDKTEFENGETVNYWNVYALPIQSTGHSLTNMAFTKNAMYLLYKGIVYTRGLKRKA